MGDRDRELLEAWRQGNRGAGDELFSRYFDEIFGFFSRKVGDDVSDLVQNTFLGIVEQRDVFRGDASVRTYLYAVARRQLYRYYRQRRRTPDLDFSVSSLHDLGFSPSSLLARKSERQLLVAALERIPLELQLTIELYYWEGLSGTEVAAIMDIPEGTVRSRLRSALDKLRGQLEQLAGSEGPWGEIASLETWAREINPYGTTA